LNHVYNKIIAGTKKMGVNKIHLSKRPSKKLKQEIVVL